MSTPSHKRRGAESLTLLITNAIKLAGLVIAVHEGLMTSHHDALTLALAAFMMAGAQFSEGALLALIDHLFGVQPVVEERRDLPEP